MSFYLQNTKTAYSVNMLQFTQKLKFYTDLQA